MSRARAPAALLIVTLTHASIARAGTDADQRAAAEMLFEQGCELARQGLYSEACPKLAESEKLDPGLGTMLSLGDCLENNGQTASAWATFTEAAAWARSDHDRREHLARDRAKKLLPRLSRLTVVVPPQAASQGLVVRRDGVVIGPPEWGVPIPVDPGMHAIGANAAGRSPWATTVQIPSSPGTLQVTIPLLDEEPTHAPLVSPGGGATASPSMSMAVETPAADRPDGSSQRTLGMVIAGAGVAALGGGAYFALHAKSTYDDANSSGHCQAYNQCDATGKQERSDAFTQATIATFALSVGVAAAAGGAFLYFTAPRDRPVSVGMAPGPGGGAAWVSVGF